MKIEKTLDSGMNLAALVETLKKAFKTQEMIEKNETTANFWVEINDEGDVATFDVQDIARLSMLAEIGYKFMEREKNGTHKVEHDEHSESHPQPAPDFTLNNTDKADCDMCLCASCITPCVGCKEGGESCKMCDNQCANTCADVICGEEEGTHEYVIHCPAYNDGHGF